MFTKKKYFTDKKYCHLFNKFRFIRNVKPVDELAIARLARHVPKQQMIAVAYKGGTIKLYMTGEWFDKMFNQF
jgi:predicted signal transduction protein with EAL and GGDEF domain